jgi:ribonuclease R
VTRPWTDPHAEREASKYEQPIPSRELISASIQQYNKPVTYQYLKTHFHLTEENDLEALRRRLRAMVRDGQLAEVDDGHYQIVDEADLIQGRVQTNKDGSGFLIPLDGSPDLFIPVRQANKACDGDIVLARVTSLDRRRGRREAAIVDIVEHAHRRIVGRFFIESGVEFVEPTNKRLMQQIVIPPHEKHSAKTGEVVMVEILSYPTDRTSAVGKIIEIVGDHMAPGMEIGIAIRAHDLPHHWPKAVSTEVSEFKKEVLEKDKKDRVDVRHLPFVTIDGEDAKDFDDAVYCEKGRWTGWRLYVAIADVSHYVKPGTALDKEALSRGNSVYFPGEVIPMLPHVLSNELCSLKARVDRLCMVCEMKLSTKGELKSYEFYPAVMNSKARLTYNEVGDFLEGKPHKVHQDLEPHVKRLHDLYKILHKHRLAAGAISFETTELKIEFGAGRKIKRLVPVTRNDAHRLIEECMLCANIAAAKFLLKKKAPTLYRVHKGAKIERLEDLRAFLKELGLELKGKNAPTPKDYAQVLTKSAGRPDAHLIQTMLLRSMSQAFYTPDNEGHFGLAFPEYAHFTSPIRRYPDLLVHRGIKAVLEKNKKLLPSHDELVKLGEKCSYTERRADEATREVMSWLKCEYMLDKLGEEFKGVVSSVTNFGLFIELENIFVEGLVHVSNLKNDYYHFDVTKQRLVGEKSGASFCLGDQVHIRVARVDLDERKIDFDLIQSDVKSSAKKKSPAKKATETKEVKGVSASKPRGKHHVAKNKGSRNAKH